MFKVYSSAVLTSRLTICPESDEVKVIDPNLVFWLFSLSFLDSLVYLHIRKIAA